MNRINGTGSLGTSGQVEGLRKDAGKNPMRKQTSNERADRIELSDEARQLVENPDDIQSSREVILAAAKQKLLTGDLLNGEALRNAADKLLWSGDLDRPSE